jgi:hypothetical protein
MKVKADIIIYKKEARIEIHIHENTVSTNRWQHISYLDENGTIIQVTFAQKTNGHDCYLEGKYPNLTFYMPKKGETFYKNFLSSSNAVLYGTALERGLRVLNGEQLNLHPGDTGVS